VRECKTLWKRSRQDTDDSDHLINGLNTRQIESEATILIDTKKMQEMADDMHQDLLELISSFSDMTTSDKASSVCGSCL
jgi:hypothetical protein